MHEVRRNKGGGTEKRGKEIKIKKKGEGQARSRGGCLKKGGDWNPLTNYEKKMMVVYLFQTSSFFLKNENLSLMFIERRPSVEFIQCFNSFIPETCARIL